MEANATADTPSTGLSSSYYTLVMGVVIAVLVPLFLFLVVYLLISNQRLRKTLAASKQPLTENKDASDREKSNKAAKGIAPETKEVLGSSLAGSNAESLRCCATPPAQIDGPHSYEDVDFISQPLIPASSLTSSHRSNTAHHQQNEIALSFLVDSLQSKEASTDPVRHTVSAKHPVSPLAAPGPTPLPGVMMMERQRAHTEHTASSSGEMTGATWPVQQLSSLMHIAIDMRQQAPLPSQQASLPRQQSPLPSQHAPLPIQHDSLPPQLPSEHSVRVDSAGSRSAGVMPASFLRDDQVTGVEFYSPGDWNAGALGLSHASTPQRPYAAQLGVDDGDGVCTHSVSAHFAEQAEKAQEYCLSIRKRPPLRADTTLLYSATDDTHADMHTAVSAQNTPCHAAVTGNDDATRSATTTGSSAATCLDPDTDVPPSAQHTLSSSGQHILLSSTGVQGSGSVASPACTPGDSGQQCGSSMYYDIPIDSNDAMACRQAAPVPSAQGNAPSSAGSPTRKYGVGHEPPYYECPLDSPTQPPAGAQRTNETYSYVLHQPRLLSYPGVRNDQKAETDVGLSSAVGSVSADRANTDQASDVTGVTAQSSWTAGVDTPEEAARRRVGDNLIDHNDDTMSGDEVPRQDGQSPGTGSKADGPPSGRNIWTSVYPQDGGRRMTIPQDGGRRVSSTSTDAAVSPAERLHTDYDIHVHMGAGHHPSVITLGSDSHSNQSVPSTSESSIPLATEKAEATRTGAHITASVEGLDEGTEGDKQNSLPLRLSRPASTATVESSGEAGVPHEGKEDKQEHCLESKVCDAATVDPLVHGAASVQESPVGRSHHSSTASVGLCSTQPETSSTPPPERQAGKPPIAHPCGDRNVYVTMTVSQEMDVDNLGRDALGKMITSAKASQTISKMITSAKASRTSSSGIYLPSVANETAPQTLTHVLHDQPADDDGHDTYVVMEKPSTQSSVIFPQVIVPLHDEQQSLSGHQVPALQDSLQTLHGAGTVSMVHTKDSCNLHQEDAETAAAVDVCIRSAEVANSPECSPSIKPTPDKQHTSSDGSSRKCPQSPKSPLQSRHRKRSSHRKPRKDSSSSSVPRSLGSESMRTSCDNTAEDTRQSSMTVSELPPAVSSNTLDSLVNRDRAIAACTHRQSRGPYRRMADSDLEDYQIISDEDEDDEDSDYERIKDDTGGTRDEANGKRNHLSESGRSARLGFLGQVQPEESDDVWQAVSIPEEIESDCDWPCVYDDDDDDDAMDEKGSQIAPYASGDEYTEAAMLQRRRHLGTAGSVIPTYNSEDELLDDYAGRQRMRDIEVNPGLAALGNAGHIQDNMRTPVPLPRR